MKSYEATATISATPDTIWGSLTDAPNYTAWDSGIVKVEGRIAPGEKIKVVSKANPKRAFPVKVTEFVSGERMTWTGGMPLGVFKGVRTFTLSPQMWRNQVHHVRGVHRAAPRDDLEVDAESRAVLPAIADGLKARAESSR